MLSILVCHSYYLRFDRKQLERAKPYPPLATLQVAALLREAGHQVSLFDAMLASGVEEFTAELGARSPDLVLLYEDNYNFLSKMCLAQMRSACLEMIGQSHRRGARVIAAGPDVSDAPGVYLRAGADVVLLGEGIATLLALLPRLDRVPGAGCAELATCAGLPSPPTEPGAAEPPQGTTPAFTPPTGPGRCDDCGWHIPRQGHRDDCPANFPPF